MPVSSGAGRLRCDRYPGFCGQTEAIRDGRPREFGVVRATIAASSFPLASIMKITWRFFVGADMRWRWQQLSTDRAVIAESETSYDDYEGCMAAAHAVGYVFEAAQGRLVRPGNEHRPRR